MRELRFRAWDGEKMHFDIVPWQWDFVISKSWHKCEKSTGSGILGSGGKTGEFLVPGIAYRDVMQYTGLKDKNGKEIYEGDIVKMKSYSFQHLDRYNYEVYYKSEEARFKFKNNIKYPHNSDSDSTGFHSFEVIGNIHENPELIK